MIHCTDVFLTTCFTPPPITTHHHPPPPTHCNNRAKEYSDAQLAAVNAAIEAHTTLLLDIKIDAPIVILPENPNAIHSKGIVADLGKFELHTSPQVEVLEDKGEEKITENAETKGETSTTAVVVDVSAQEDQTTNANDFQRRNAGDLNNVELVKEQEDQYLLALDQAKLEQKATDKEVELLKEEVERLRQELEELRISSKQQQEQDGTLVLRCLTCASFDKCIV